MTTQLCSRRGVSVFRVSIFAVALPSILAVRDRAMATPVFVQAYGPACYTQMPMLNGSGRYILHDYGDAGLGEVDDALEHAGRRSSSKLAFVRGKTLLLAAHVGNATRGDSSLQWRGAFADPAKPYEVGSLGLTGSVLIPAVHVAHANAVAPYSNRGPRTGSTSFDCEFAAATDSIPGYSSSRVASSPIQPAGSTRSEWMIGPARQLVEHERDHGTVNFTYDQTNQVVGEIGVTRLIPSTGFQTGGGPGFSYNINPYTRLSTTVYLQNQRPALSILMGFKPSLW